MVLSLCEERERTRPPAAAGSWSSVAQASGGGVIVQAQIKGLAEVLVFFPSLSFSPLLPPKFPATNEPDSRAEARTREAADIPCKAVYQWPAGRTLGAAQHA